MLLGLLVSMPGTRMKAVTLAEKNKKKTRLPNCTRCSVFWRWNSSGQVQASGKMWSPPPKGQSCLGISRKSQKAAKCTKAAHQCSSAFCPKPRLASSCPVQIFLQVPWAQKQQRVLSCAIHSSVYSTDFTGSGCQLTSSAYSQPASQ